MNDFEKLQEMFAMQMELNEKVERRMDISIYDSKVNGNLYLAIVDEVGELNHELKKMWCYWKKSCKPVDREHLLEELVDIWHFILTDYLLRRVSSIAYRDIEYVTKENIRYVYPDAIRQFNAAPDMINLMRVTFSLGYDFNDIYEAYKKKNAVNHERMDGSY